MYFVGGLVLCLSTDLTYQEKYIMSVFIKIHIFFVRMEMKGEIAFSGNKVE